MRLPFVGLILFVLGVSNGAAQVVIYNIDRTVDFSKFKTYKWVSIKNAQQVVDVTASQITATVDAELAKKGLTKTGSEDADLYVGYQTAGGNQKQSNAYNVGLGNGTGSAAATFDTIHAGQLVVDMYEAANKKLVWRGVAAKTIDAKAKPDKRQKSIQNSVEKLLNNYPPKQK
ncbi:MAG: DUF4136 domain-containing protein [Candidatus Acidiferrum sp.]